jgi:5-oxoprolinase (ATP-hydrolysing) subunit C
MTGALEVLDGGLFAIVVDRGRFGFRGEGVATGGPLDTVAFAAANLLAGNDADAAALEIAFGGLKIRFDAFTRFALAGAACAADLDGARVDVWGSYEAHVGARLTLRRPRASARTYLAVAGGIGVPRVLNSRDTNVAASFGGYEGRALRTGDRVPLESDVRRAFPPGARPRCKPPQWDFAAGAFERPELAVRFLAGGEFAILDKDARDAFWSNAYAIAPQSNRMGARLTGAAALAFAHGGIPSHAVFPGVVQLPPSGEPIVLLADAQTTGGYPKLGCAIEIDLWKIAQLPIGSRLHFVPCSMEEAAEARREVVSYLDRVEASLP